MIFPFFHLMAEVNYQIAAHDLHLAMLSMTIAMWAKKRKVTCSIINNCRDLKIKNYQLPFMIYTLPCLV